MDNVLSNENKTSIYLPLRVIDQKQPCETSSHHIITHH
jgi:hypothetical protein